MDKECEIRESIEYAIELMRFTPPMDVFISSMNDLDTTIEEADVIYHYEKIYELIYAHLISILETYLSDT